jgi:TolA-binding protein
MNAFVEFASRYKTHARAADALFRVAQLTLITGRQGSVPEARTLFGEVAEQYPQSPLAPQALAEKAAIEDRLRLREVDQEVGTSVPASLVTLRALVQKYPASPLAEKAWWTLAGLYEDAKRYDLAARACESLAASFPATAYDAWFRAGELYEKRVKDQEKARAAYARVPAASPRYKDAQKRIK